MLELSTMDPVRFVSKVPGLYPQHPAPNSQHRVLGLAVCDNPAVRHAQHLRPNTARHSFNTSFVMSC